MFLVLIQEHYTIIDKVLNANKMCFDMCTNEKSKLKLNNLIAFNFTKNLFITKKSFIHFFVLIKVLWLDVNLLLSVCNICI